MRRVWQTSAVPMAGRALSPACGGELERGLADSQTIYRGKVGEPPPYLPPQAGEGERYCVPHGAGESHAREAAP